MKTTKARALRLFGTRLFMRLIILLYGVIGYASEVTANVIVTPANNGLNITADKAANALSPAYTVLSDIQISENVETDFPITGGISQTIILTAPAGWIFNAGSGTVSFSGGDISTATITVTATEITIFIDIVEDDFLDVLTLSGIEVQAIDGTVIPNGGHIYQSTGNPGSMLIAGITSTSNTDGSGGTDFGALSQMAGAADRLVFAVQPDLAVVATVFGQQPVLVSQDQFGNLTANGLASSQLVTLSLSTGTGLLTGTVSMDIGTASGNGTVSFTDLQVNASGIKRLTASSPGLLSEESVDFIVSQASTSTTLTTDINPGCPGAGITLTATVNPATASGTVSFYDGVLLIGTASLSGGQAVLVTSTLQTGSHNLTAVYNGDTDYSGSSSAILLQNIDPAPPVTPGSIAGSLSLCPGTTGNVYSISAVPDAISYTWTVPAGWLITAGQGSVSITVTAGSAGQNGDITVVAQNSCGTSPSQNLSVIVNPAAPVTPGTISGPSPVCPNTAGLVYSVSAVPNASNYNWGQPPH